MLNAYLWTLAIASYITTILYAYDKQLAETHRPRLSEFYLLIATAMGGTVGAVIGMILFNHKANMSKKWYFLMGLLVSIVIQTIILLLLLGAIEI